MAGSVYMALCEAARALLATGLGAEADGGVHTGRRKRPMAEQHTRQVHVLLDYARFERGDTSVAPNDNATRLRVECAGRTDAALDLPGDKVADALATHCYALLTADPMALDVGGLNVMDLVPVGVAWDGDDADTAIGVVQLLFDIKHRTASTSITAP